MTFKPLSLAILLFSAAGPVPLGALPYGAGDHDVSEYMIGSVVVNVIYPESSSGGETWDSVRKNNVTAAIQAAMDWWAAREPRANLSFVYNVRTESTEYEPITCYANSDNASGDDCTEGDWIGDIMTRMGYSGEDYFEQVYAYDHAMRLAYGTDWSFTMFVADSFWDADGMFPDGYFAYTYLGGPFSVLTYDNGAYGISGMAAVSAHETGHIFYAMDEYAEAGCTTTERSGYLNAANLNCQNGGTSDTCIMRGQVSPYNAGAVCDDTRLQLGWSPVGGSDPLDIVDLPPTTALIAHTPDPTTDNTPSYSGVAHSTAAYPNANEYGPPAMRYYYTTPPPVVDLSVLKVAGVEYRVDAGAWQQASPQDSAFDQEIDSFTFTTSVLSNAAHVIYARAKDNFGVYDPSPASDSLTVNNELPSDILNVYDGTTTAYDIDYTRESSSLSANWDASSYLGGNPDYYEYRIGTTPGGAEISGWTDVGVTTGVTRSGLGLVEDTTYYFAVRAVGMPGTVYSGVTVSNGQRVDVTSPTARVEIASSLPAKTGTLSLKLIVTESNGLSGTPVLSFATSDGVPHPVALTYVAGTSTWTASHFIESWYSTGTAVFSFRAFDAAGNSGSSVTAGGTFLLDTSVNGSSASVVANSDNNAVILPAGAYSGDLLVTISTVPSSRTALADAARSEARPLKGSDLTREFFARTPDGGALTKFAAPVTIKMCYPDADNDGRIDGDYIDESRTGLYWLDESSYKWTRVSDTVRDTKNNCLSAPVSHFSVYSIRVLDPDQSGMGNIKAFPSPCYFDRPPSVLTIRGIPLDAVRPEIDIYDVAGELVRTLKPGDGIEPFFNDGLWDGRRKGGGKAASGLYIYLVRTANYGKASGKFYIFW